MTQQYLTRADLLQHPAFAHLSTDSSGNPCVWSNSYECDNGHARNSWTDEWSCQCDDECAICGASYAADSEWIGPDDDALVELWTGLPEAGNDDPSPPPQPHTAENPAQTNAHERGPSGEDQLGSNLSQHGQDHAFTVNIVLPEHLRDDAPSGWFSAVWVKAADPAAAAITGRAMLEEQYPDEDPSGFAVLAIYRDHISDVSGASQ